MVHVDVVLGDGRPGGATICAFQQGHTADGQVRGVVGVHFDEPEIVTVTVTDFVQCFFVGAHPCCGGGVDATGSLFSGPQRLGMPSVHFGANDGGVKHLGIGVTEVVGQRCGIEVSIGYTLKQAACVCIFWKPIFFEKSGECGGIQGGKGGGVHGAEILGFKLICFVGFFVRFGVLVVHDDVKAGFTGVVSKAHAADPFGGGKPIGCCSETHPGRTPVDGFEDTTG